MRARVVAVPLCLAVLSTAPLIVSCAGTSPLADGSLAEPERAAIADSVRRLWVSRITFDGADVVRRFMSLYPDSGRVVSAASGGFTTTRDSLQAALTNFWETVGKNMRQPRWVWGRIVVDVLARNSVVATAQYTVPHWTPDGAPHVIGGAWTSVWVNRGGRWVIVQEHLSDLPRPVAERLESQMRPLKQPGSP